MKNNFAEILYDLKNYIEAYEQYMGVVKMDPKGKYSIDCATNAIIAANNKTNPLAASSLKNQIKGFDK